MLRALAGLALEVLGQVLRELKVPQEDVIISNKLGWKRIPLVSSEPTFEPGVWVGLSHDAVQDLSYEGIMTCYHQGNDLLGFASRFVSVHDPDEYLAGATDDNDLEIRRRDILECYRALADLKRSGAVLGIGVGSKDPRTIDWLIDHVSLDWAMIACSLTVHSHDSFTQILLKKLYSKGVKVINSGVFNSGFLVDGSYYNYQKVTAESHPDIVDQSGAAYDEVSVKFSFLFNEVDAVALNPNSIDTVLRDFDIVYGDASLAHVYDRLTTEGLMHVVKLLPIAQTGDPVLERIADEVDLESISTQEIQDLISSMKMTMYAAPGIGLAAPQVSRSLRIIVFYLPATRDDVNGKGISLSVLINPHIQVLDNDRIIDWEGCLSVQGKRGKVSRANHIRYSGFDECGRFVDVEAKGWHARLVQHECDHLDGILYPTLISEEDSLISVEEWRAKYANK